MLAKNESCLQATLSFQSLQTLWHECVLNEAAIWTAFHAFWLRQAMCIPILLVRYEDLLNNQKDVMREMSAFLEEGSPPVGLKRFSATTVAAAPSATDSSRTSDDTTSASNSNSKLSISASDGVDGGVPVSAASLETVFSKLNLSGNKQTGNVSDSNRNGDSSNTPKEKLSGTHTNSTSQSTPAAVATTTDKSGPTGYAPKKKKVGKALQVMSVEDVFAVVRSTNQLLKDFGYDLAASSDQSESQYSLQLTPMTDSNGGAVYSRRLDASSSPFVTQSGGVASKFDATEGVMKINESFSVRHIDDKFGRLFTETRREITANDSKPFETL
eukprot:gene22862-29039_t